MENNLFIISVVKDIEAAAAIALLPLLLKEKKGKDEVFLKNSLGKFSLTWWSQGKWQVYFECQ